MSSKERNLRMHPSEARGFIFDIDGTIADSWKLGFDATQVVLENNNIPVITEELYHECTKYSTPIRLAYHAGLEPSDEQFSILGERLAKEFDDLYVGLVTTETAGFYKGIDELLYDIAKIDTNVRIAALTNACVAYAHAVLKVNCPKISNGSQNNDGIYEKFVSIHGADTVPQPKPKPDGLYKCCEEIGLKPHQCVYIGDSPSDGVAAKAAGCLAIGVLYGSHSMESLKNAPFDYLCADVDELKRLLIARQ